MVKMNKCIKWNILWVEIIFLFNENARVGYYTTSHSVSKKNCHTFSGAIILDKNLRETSAENLSPVIKE